MAWDLTDPIPRFSYSSLVL